MAIKKIYKRIVVLVQTAVFFGMLGTGCKTVNNVLPDVQHIEPHAERATSLATVVGDVPLAFTNQFFPFDESGNLIGASNLSEQVDQVLENSELVLNSAGTGLTDLVRIHVYLQDDSYYEKVLERIGEVLPEGSHPAVTLISGGQALPGVMVSMDMVAVAPQVAGGKRVGLFRADGLLGPENRSHVAVLSPGRRIFISGQAEAGDNLREASINTMRNLFATLAYLGANAEDVVQVKAFINPIEDATTIEREIASFFRGRHAPPIVTVEWLHEPNRAEIELIASAPAEPTRKEAVSYYAPNWMSQATTFSRVVDIHRGGLIFTSGLYGEKGENGEAQARTIFNTLSRLLEEAGSDYGHLVKATYYPSKEEGREGLVNVRTGFYNPDKPPAASLIRVQGIGRQGAGIMVDMIGVVPE